MNDSNLLLSGINAILRNYKIAEVITPADISITNNIIYDGHIENPKLTNAIINHYWPSVNEAEVYHFTSKENAESICNSKLFRLTNIEKRWKEDEIKGFCERYLLDGYLEVDTHTNQPKYKTLLMPELFYASFAETDLTKKQEESLWRKFADTDGVRIKLKILAERPDFRKIFYGPKKNASRDLLKELTNLAQKHKRKFSFGGISKMCAFYLPYDYDQECEYRLLIKKFRDSSKFKNKSSGDLYIEIPLEDSTETGYYLEILEVESNVNLSISSNYAFVKRVH